MIRLVDGNWPALLSLHLDDNAINNTAIWWLSQGH